MNGEVIPGLMDSVRGWITKNQDPETGLVFGLTVGGTARPEYPCETYRFAREGDYPLMVIIWDKGDLFVEKADLILDADVPVSEAIYCEGLEFEETEPLIAMAEKFIKENECPAV